MAWRVIIEVGGFAGFAIASNGVVNWIVELRFVRSKLEEEVGDFAFNFFDAGGGFVDFVDDDDWLQVEGEGFLENELSSGAWGLPAHRQSRERRQPCSGYAQLRQKSQRDPEYR